MSREAASAVHTSSASRLGPLIGCALLVAIWWPFLAGSGLESRQSDWNLRANYFSYTVTSLLTYGEIPFWASGPDQLQGEYRFKTAPPHSFFANPETEVLSPFVPLYVWFSFATAVKIAFLVHLAVGLLGLAALLDLWGIRHPLIHALTAVLVFGGAFFVRHLLIGHFQFVTFAYLPLALFLYWRVLDDPLDGRAVRSLSLSGAVLALAYYEGGAHLCILFLLMLGVLGACQLAFGGLRRLGLFAKLAILVAAFIILAGFKLFPGIAEYAGYVPDGTLGYLNPGQMLRYAIDLFPAYPPRLPQEVSLYCGLTGLVILGLGVVGVQRRYWPVALTLVILGACMLLPVAAFLRAVPVIGTQRLARLGGELVMLAALLSADLLARGERFVRARLAGQWSLAVFGGVLAILVMVVAKDEGAALRAVMARGEPRASSLAAANPVPLRAETCGHEPIEVTVTPEGPNRFVARWSGVIDGATPPAICLPDVSAGEARRSLAIVGTGEALSVNDRFAVQPATGSTTVRLRYDAFAAKAGLATTLAGILALIVLLASGGHSPVR